MEIVSLFNSLNTMDDLRGLISNEIRESEVLEYKTSDGKFSDSHKKEIAKDVSAMANSNGGVIIYGIETDSRDKTKPIRVSGIHETNIETFDRVVNSQIKKDIKGIQKKIISESSTHAMVVFIPQSEDSPHQCLIDKRYYRRSLAESLPMEHDILELHFGKRLSPILDLVVLIVNREEEPARLSFKEDGFSEPLKVRFMIYNSGRKVGKYVEAIFRFPESRKVKIVNSDTLVNIDDLYLQRRQQARQFTQPIEVFHPLMRKKIADVTIQVAKEWFEGQSHTESLVEWVIYADEMNPRSGNVLLPGGQP